jgi:hypothetical protein
MELCRDCCDPGEVVLSEKEEDQFREFVRKERNGKIRRRSP